METIERLQNDLLEIEKWEKEQKKVWFWERLGRIPFKLLDKFTPQFIQNKVGLLLDELGNFIQNGGKYLTRKEMIFKKLQKRLPDLMIEHLSDIENLPIDLMNEVSEELEKNRKDFATVQGATTGIGGIFTLAIDIPLLLGVSLKTLQEIAVTYGFDPNERKERIFIVKCLQFSTADVVGKKAILNELSTYYKGGTQQKEMLSQLQGWREVVYTYRDQFGWKKLLQMVPIAGMIFGAFTNRAMIQDLSEAGIMLYRKRRIMKRLKELQTS
ncbi:hypothetical protein J2S13_001116 [Oikeobacillus pervagus]|uniref:EcsC family protein n=1 Tax=Oikeobacillus pervagus TaxID=1325931 RepID=A0AAJ1T2I2_9BACI|nr:EcsC family protein [Oikeobacillus pervagus]MDQ0214719.1 hypothetical protein [Oikeobacillus pervagus]